MAVIFHEEDSTLEPIAGLAIAIVGYGNQGRSQALNLRDSGLRVLVGNIDDDYRKTAIADGFSPLPIRQAASQADVIFLLVPDEVMPEVYRNDVEPGLAPGKVLVFVDTVKELSATILLRPFGFNTLATYVYENASRGVPEEGAVAAILIVLTALVPVVLLSGALAKDREASL